MKSDRKANVTPKILICWTRFSPLNVSRVWKWDFLLLPMKTVSSLLLRFSERLFMVAQSLTLLSSAFLVSTLEDKARQTFIATIIIASDPGDLTLSIILQLISDTQDLTLRYVKVIVSDPAILIVVVVVLNFFVRYIMTHSTSCSFNELYGCY